MFKLASTLLIIALVSSILATKTLDSHLSSQDLERLQKVFQDGVKSNDVQTIHYSAINLEKLNKNEGETICKRLFDSYGDSKLNEFEKNYYLSNGQKALGCSTSLPANVATSIKSSITKETSTSQELYYNILSYKTLNLQLDTATKTKISKNLEKILKKDDSLNSLGHGFLVAAELGKDGVIFYDRIEDAIVQADEVDGKMLQFEGGLSITSLIVSGALKLTSSLGISVPLNDEQIIKFSSYFLSRRSVQTAKGASILIESLKLIAALKENAPISIELYGSPQILPNNQKLIIKICDILGRSFAAPLAVVHVTITGKPGGEELTSKTNLVPSATENSLYSLDLRQFKPTRGVYNVDIVAGKYNQKLAIKIIGKIKVSSLEIGIGDSDSSSQVKKQNVVFPNKLDNVLQADAQQKVVIKVSLVDNESGKAITVHQAFVRLSNKESKEEIIFVAEQDTSKSYKFDMDVGARSADFGSKSGLYTIELIIGDSSISNSFKWNLADIQLKFVSNEISGKSETDNPTPLKASLPEIEHKFREPESRPPRFFSDLFSLLCIAPLLLLLILWAKLRVNISNFPFSLSSFGFHLGLGAILSLFGIFWLQLNMFETIRYLLPIALFTFLCGNRLLRSIAAKRNEK